MANTVYSEETKAAVMAALLSGQSVGQVAAEYKLPKGTVSTWKRKIEGIPQVGSPAQQEEIGELVLGYLRAILTALTKQAVHFGDKSWLQNQGASELAVLHGVSADKALRLLEALEGPRGDE